ncbi:1-acyl-sn-glycerol-3-phosphate acyltransferase [Candidatus Saccharibacteria bacterium]|nr:1-acyl-sn-glycerol-3-phosphate acyltransferase [Candidatus Saccharibacteria bacterium]
MSEIEPSHLLAPRPKYYDFVMHTVVPSIIWKMGGLEQRGGEVINDISGPIIIAPNHRHFNDTFAVHQAVYDATIEQTQMYSIAKDELRTGKFARIKEKFIEWGGGIFVDQEATTIPVETEEKIDNVLRNNGILLIFPEGTRMSGPIIDLKKPKGVPRLAAKAGATVVPVGIGGTEVDEAGKHGPYRVVFGEPIEIEAAPGVPNNIPDIEKNKLQRKSDRIMVANARMLRDVLTGHIQEVFDEAQSWSNSDR